MSKLNKKQINKYARMALILILAVLFLAALYGLYYIYHRPAQIEQEVPSYIFEHNAGITYSAAIKPNTVFKETALGPGKTIYRKLMDSFTTISTYQYKADKAAKIKVTYNVIATLEAKDMWKLNFVLVPQTNFAREGKEASFRNEQPVDLTYFDQVVKMVDEEIGVSAREPSLTITTNINLEADTGEGVIKENMAPHIIIPLAAGSLKVEGEPSIQKEGSMNQKIMLPNPLKGKFIYAQAAAAASGLLLLLFLLFTQNKLLKLDSYEIFWNEFWRKYRDRIIKINHNLYPDNFIAVNSMEDLVKVADELAKPVIFRDGASVSEPAACYVFDGPTVYRYEIVINIAEAKQEIECLSENKAENRNVTF